MVAIGMGHTEFAFVGRHLRFLHTYAAVNVSSFLPRRVEMGTQPVPTTGTSLAIQI